jgi:hypothetical protein
VEFRRAPQWSTSLGELAYEVVRAYVASRDDCREARLATLAGHREAFVAAVDHMVDDELVAALPALVGDAIAPAVDRGDLPAITAALAEALRLLVEDPDPERPALTALVALLNQRTALEPAHAVDLAARVLAAPAIDQTIDAGLGLALLRDGSGYTVDTALGMLSSALADQDAPTCGWASPSVDPSWLTGARFPAWGQPAWIVRRDRHGNPAVHVTAGGALVAPFVDADGDGSADVNGDGLPHDRHGQVIVRPPFARGPGYDPAERAVAENGQLVYQYVDAKRTVLAQLARMAGDAVAVDLHRDLLAVADALLGPPQPCATGERDCWTYDPAASPLHTLMQLGLAAAQFERLGTLVATVSAVLRDDPERAERLLVAAGQLIDAVVSSSVDVLDPHLLDLIDQLLPVVAKLLPVPSSAGGPSTPRLLMQVVDELSRTVPEAADRLRLTVEHSSLVSNRECSSQLPDAARSPRVDFGQPRYYRDAAGRWVDNRSSLERSLELLVNADCGSVPFSGGRSVAHVVLDLLAARTPSTVCGLIDVTMGALGIVGSLGGGVVDATLWTIGCRDRAHPVGPELRALDGLAKSGALALYLPLAQVFRDRGQLHTVLAIARVIAADLRRDDDNDAGTRSAVRQLLPVLAELLRSSVADALFELNRVMLQVPASDGDGTLADVVIELVAHLVAVPDGPAAGQGPRRAWAAELIGALRTLAGRVRSAPLRASLGRIVRHFAGYLATELDDRGTVDPADDRHKLRDAAVVPLVSLALAAASEVLAQPQADRDCWLSYGQKSVRELVAGRSLADGVRLARLIAADLRSRQLEQLARQLLPATGPADPGELLGPLLQVSSELAASELGAAGSPALMQYLGAVLAPTRLDGPGLLAAVDRLFDSDRAATAISLAQRGFDRSESASGVAPAMVIAQVVADVWRPGEPATCAPAGAQPLTVDRAAAFVSDVVDFMTDDEFGLGALYELIRLRASEGRSSGA